jgi:hypothetical protein
VGTRPCESWPGLRMLNAMIAARCALSMGHGDRLGHRRLESWFDMYVGC